MNGCLWIFGRMNGIDLPYMFALKFLYENRLSSVYFSIHLYAFTEVSGPGYIQPNTVWWRHQCRSSSLERRISYWHQQLPTHRTWCQSKEHHNVQYNNATSYTTYSINECWTVTSLLSLFFFRAKWRPHCSW